MKKSRGLYIVSGIMSILTMIVFLIAAVGVAWLGISLTADALNQGSDPDNALLMLFFGWLAIFGILIVLAIFIGAILLVVLAFAQLASAIVKFKLAAHKYPKKKVRGMIAAIVFDFIFLVIAFILAVVRSSGAESAESIKELNTIGLVGVIVFLTA